MYFVSEKTKQLEEQLRLSKELDRLLVWAHNELKGYTNGELVAIAQAAQEKLLESICGDRK